MKCDILIRTWKPDLPWLAYCLKFLRKNWREHSSGIVIVANEDCAPEMTGIMAPGADPNYWRGERVYYVKPWPDTSSFKCYLTLLADEFSDAELIMFLDSDHMLVRPAMLADFMEENCPVIYYRELAEMDDPTGRMAAKLWPPIMERYLGRAPTRDYMQLFPILYWTDSITSVRRLVAQRTGRSVHDALFSGTHFDVTRFGYHPHTFCEFNVLGFWCDLHEPKRYRFRAATPGGAQEKVLVYHSWTQWNKDTQKELEKLLAS